MFTKGKFMELLRACDPDPNFLVMIINYCFEQLPDAVSWKLAQQVYLKYFFDGEPLKIRNKITGQEMLFASYNDIVNYLHMLGYSKANYEGVSRAFKHRSEDYCNHEFFRDKEKEITYFVE